MRRLHIFALLTLIPALASAQEVNFPVVNFHPAVNPEGFYVTEWGKTLPHLTPTAALILNYAHRPLELLNADDGSFDHSLVNYQFNADLMLGIGFYSRFEVGLALPITLAQGTDGLEALGRSPGASLSGGLGDIRLIPKVRLLTKSIFSLALAAPLSLPTGSDSNLLGDESVTWTPQAVAAVELKRVALAFNLGYTIRKEQGFDPPGGKQHVSVDDAVPMSIAARARVWKELDVLGDMYWAISTNEVDKEEVPLELLLGGRYTFPFGLIANLGFGAGLTQGLGTPAFRILAGVGYIFKRKEPPPPAPVVDLDPDKDGILNPDDACPNDPEDKDGFEDTDGCPEADNDKDGILDADDKCPNDPEDKDSFEDEDGCPDTDNDKDGILDADDKCPMEPEDKDGFEDEDGCPDTDNDKDTILDVKDQCPMEPEVFNGVDDEDGCPDKGKGKVQIDRNKITVPPVFFATAKDKVLKRSLPTLKEVAETLKANAWVKKVRIEGHTDDRGKDEFNMDLSQRRANSVMQHLISFGLEASRVEAQGFGETRPVADNKTAKGRAKNRRVDFVIIDPAQAQAAPPTDAATP